MEDIDIKINNFHKSIDEWIHNNHIDIDNEKLSDRLHEVTQLLHLSRDEVSKMSSIECQTAVYVLNQHLGHLKMRLAREKAVKAWAEQGIGYLITGSKHDKYAKWEEKYYESIRSSQTGIKLQTLKTTADARILAGEATIGTIENAMRVLENLARSKNYEQRS
jgi:hypothetical protein